VRILFDQNVPRKLRRHPRGHYVITADESGWAESTNGDLLQLAENAGFDLLISTDQNIAYQQNLAGRRIALLILNSNHWDEVQSGIPLISEAVAGAGKGSFVFLEVRPSSNHTTG
jgi:hypothetical protein